MIHYRNIITTFFFSLILAGNLQGQDLIVFKSKHLKCNDSILVFTPENFKRDDSIPTLFLLHGYSGNYKNWSEKYDIQEVSNRYGFRIICPDGFYNSWYVDNIDPEKMQWRKFFNEELFPDLEERFSLSPENTFISGLSMGGHGAINLFIDHPEWYRSAGSMSGVMNLHHTPIKTGAMQEVFGEYEGNPRFDEESAIVRAIKISGTDKPLILSCGYDDVTYAKSTEDFAKRCKELNIPHFVTLSKGTHSWTYWGYALELHLWMFSKILNGDNLGY